MFNNTNLKTLLDTSSVIQNQSAVIAEWNLNTQDNVDELGNYRFRPNIGSPTTANFGVVQPTYAKETSLTSSPFYYGATDSNVSVDGGFDNYNVAQAFTSTKEKQKLLFSLQECLGRFRPRSGINKAVHYSANSYLNYSDQNMFSRPRYYMADKDDKFKYWTSFRTEVSGTTTTERGISKNVSGTYYIDDAAPFVKYKNAIPANRLIVKMQTNVGTVGDSTLSDLGKVYADPFYGSSNKTTPVIWKVQTLQGSTWTDAISFDGSSVRSDSSPIIKEDGYVELAYGITNIPTAYKSNMVFAGKYSSIAFLPTTSIIGYTYLVQTSSTDIGTYYVWQGTNGYLSFVPTYGWYLNEEGMTNFSAYETNLTSPDSYVSGTTKYRNFQYLQGIRIVVSTMNKEDCAFDLIEMSPRLAVDLTDKVSSFSVTKSASDLGSSGMPVGQLLASTGDITIFDYDLAFSLQNPKSILNIVDSYNNVLNSFSSKNLQLKFYEVIYNSGEVYYVPIKTLYSEGFPKSNNKDRSVTLSLRDMFFYFESTIAPQLMISNVSLSYAIALLLDSIGFSNYKYYRITGETDLIIPYFFIAPDTTVAQALNALAQSAQAAMFFDEYNNFIVMSKKYFMPTATDRATDTELNGSKYHPTSSTKLANIIDIQSQERNIYNDGKINYSTRYIQRSMPSISQASFIDQNRVWTYKPALLWEISPSDDTKSINNELSQQAAYSLAALPLNSDLSAQLPQVDSSGLVVNNFIDFGEGIYWLPRYNGYFFANGEIIKYDAVEYSISGVGNVWLSSVQEYQKYFASLKFNGKIFPTGRVRIYSEPYYDSASSTGMKIGSVAKHGRGQFGTSIVSHTSGINPSWKNNVIACQMNSRYLFGSSVQTSVTTGPAGIISGTSKNANITGIIKNYWNADSTSITETALNANMSIPGTMQSSALVMSGPNFASNENALDFISYTYKTFTASTYSHYGTRMRIIGSTVNDSIAKIQNPIGSYPYFTNIGGASGGLGIWTNPVNNNGYYFEIVALTDALTSNSFSNGNFFNVVFYKLGQGSSSVALPVVLWKGLTSIFVDNGQFTGQGRVTAEANPSMYDLAVEYEKTSSGYKFYLFINQQLVSTVEDTSPLPLTNTVSLFVRGSAKVMFENVYAISANYSKDSQTKLAPITNSVFTDSSAIRLNDSFSKYAMSGMVQQTYLSGISSKDYPDYNMFYDEFGTIMREAAYFNIKYDKAFPTLYAKLSPTFTSTKGYTVSGFRADAYGAEFMIFNNTDTVLNLDNTSGNYLRIQGITFTQQSNNSLSVDEYFSKKSDLSNPIFENGTTVNVQNQQQYSNLKASRSIYGKKEFAVDAQYLQTQDAANELMGWMISKIMKPRYAIGLSLFAMPTLQLGDIVTINYKDENLNDIIPSTSRFVVYHIEYSKSNSGPQMNAYVSEVV